MWPFGPFSPMNIVFMLTRSAGEFRSREPSGSAHIGEFEVVSPEKKTSLLILAWIEGIFLVTSISVPTRQQMASWSISITYKGKCNFQIDLSTKYTPSL